MNRRAHVLPLFTSALLGLGACGDDETATASGLDGGTAPDASAPTASLGGGGGLDAAIEPGFMAVSLRFKAEVSGEDFACGRTYAGQGSTKVAARPADFRFFVERVRLVTRAGVEVPLQLLERAPHQTSEVALIDFTGGDGACVAGSTPANTVLTGKAPVGDYSGVVFSNGVPEALNHADPTAAPPPLRAPGVNWSWLRGYRFFLASLQVAPQADGGATGDGGVASPSDVGPDGGAVEGGAHGDSAGVGIVHVGALSCTGGVGVGFSCAKPNRNEVRLTGFDPATSTIVADLGAVFADVDLVQGVVCHVGGEDYCGRVFPSIGLDLATGAALPTQRVFHVE